MNQQLPSINDTDVSLCQDYERGKGLAFHFDKDEALFKEHGRMEHPLLSSVLYLTGSGNSARLGAPQMVRNIQASESGEWRHKRGDM